MNFYHRKETFTDKELQTISDVQLQIIDEYPPEFIEKNKVFLESTKGSGYFLDNSLEIKDFLTSTMHQKLQGELPVCCAVCAETCWISESYKILVHELPPVCNDILNCREETLSQATKDFYNISELIKDKRLHRTYSKLMLARASLDHNKPDCLPIEQNFYF